jgi:hypothetical protein
MSAPTLTPTALIANYYCGVDCGQVNDYTAIAILKHIWARWEVVSNVRSRVDLPASQMQYHVVHLERLRLGMSYPDQVDIVRQRFEAIPVAQEESKTLLVDATGVGRAVVDLMREKDLYPIPITIVGASPEGGGKPKDARHVPKRDLVAALNVLMQSGRFKIAAGLQEGQTLAKELQNFQYKLTDSKNVQYEAWREGQHDDLVLAVALPAWLAHRYSRGA